MDEAEVKQLAGVLDEFQAQGNSSEIAMACEIKRLGSELGDRDGELKRLAEGTEQLPKIGMLTSSDETNVHDVAIAAIENWRMSIKGCSISAAEAKNKVLEIVETVYRAAGPTSIRIESQELG